MSETKTTRYYNKHILSKDIKIVRTIVPKEKSIFYSLLTCTISNFINFSEQKKKSYVENFIKSFIGDFKDNVIKFYNYIEKKEIEGLDFFTDKIIKKPSYIELYSMICKLIKLQDVFDLHIMLENAYTILNKTNLDESRKNYFYKKYSTMLNTIYNYTKNDIVINEQIIVQISKNLNRNIYCIDYYNDERIVFSSDTDYAKSIIILKIKDNFEPLGIVDEESVIKREFYNNHKVFKNILNILLQENLESESILTSSSESELENSFE
jgi:hypothetical protein